MTIRQPLTLGQLNDGIEPQFPTSDIPDLTAIAQVTFDSELDRPLSLQVPEHICIQGPADDPDRSRLGITIQRDLMTVQDVTWTALTPRNWLLVVRADFRNCPLPPPPARPVYPADVPLRHRALPSNAHRPRLRAAFPAGDPP